MQTTTTQNYQSGFLLINKPSGPTSHDMINRLRRIIGIKKIGHAGTLDPFASGLMIIAISREATREISSFVKLEKEYIATLFLGAETDTYDRMGKFSEATHIPTNSEADAKCEPAIEAKIKPAIDEIKEVLQKFIGEQEQIPPMYSAKKVNGRKLYEIARKGETIERQAIRICINQIDLLKYDFPLLQIKVNCSTGTYIRSLAFDIGRSLRVGAHLDQLERTRIGKYSIKKAVKIEEVGADNWQDYLI